MSEQSDEPMDTEINENGKILLFCKVFVKILLYWHHNILSRYQLKAMVLQSTENVAYIKIDKR